MSGNLFEQQRTNRRKSAWLVAGFLAFFAWIGFGLDLVLYLETRHLPPASYHHVIPFAGFVAVTLAAGLVWFSWRRGPRGVLWATGAWELVMPRNDAERQFVNVAEEMAIAAGLPRPTLWVVPDPDPNAFATGVQAHRAHVAVTEGLLTTLNRDELQAVVGHEMGHIKNDDVRLMTLLAALVGVMGIIAEGTGRFLRHSGGRRGGKGKGGGGLAVAVLVVWLISVMLAPLLGRLLALGVSRKREYLADAMSAQFTRNPGALADALQKIEHAAAPTAAIKRGAAHLCIADPLGRRVTSKEGFLADLLGTHPPMATRVARLRQMAYQYQQTGQLPTVA